MPGWRNLIVCDGVKVPCTFAKLIELIQVGIHDLVLLSTLLVIGVFVMAGIKLLSSGGNPGALTEVKSMLWSVVMGYMWILAAWLIVYTITSILLKPGYSLLLGGPKAN